VRLASTVHCELQHDSFPVSKVDDVGLRELEAWCDVLVFQGHVMHDFPWLRDSRKVLIVDIYDPIHLEVLEQSREQTDWDRRNLSRITVEVLNEQLARGDHFLCASEKQRDFWLGQLAAVGRLNPATYDDGENLERLISVVPFGLDDDAPRRTRPAIRGVVPGIGPDDKVVLWGGGIYNWFDPLTLVRAIDKLRRRLPEVRLYFMGLTHPNPNVPAMRMAYDTQRLAEELGLTNEFVFFNEGWVDYDDRQNYLLDADVGVSNHLDHVETAFSFRTRILDYFWASLPVVATAGDSFAEIIEVRKLGLVVPPEDVDALEDALYTVLTDADFAQECRANVAAAAPDYRWSRVLVPVLDLCTQPRRAPDLVDPRQRVMIGDPIAQAMWGRRGLAYSVRVALRHAKRREYGELTRKARMRVRAALFPESAGPGAR
jgi:glycosyltransferase involved in cell wall biosynthesis